MKKYYLLSVLFLLGVTNFTIAQTKYYKLSGGSIVDSVKLEDVKKNIVKKMYDKDSTLIFAPTITEAYRNQDSIVYDYKFSFKPKSGRLENSLTKTSSFNGGKYLTKAFPLTELKTIDGRKLSINDLKGKPSMISFWFTTCAPCIEEMPELNKISENLKGQVNFIAISFEEKEKVSSFLKKQPFNFNQITDAKEFVDKIGMDVYPTNIFLDKEGKVVAVKNGIPKIKTASGSFETGSGKAFEDILRSLL